MKQYTQQEIDAALTEIAAMSHSTMCYKWRHEKSGSIYFRSDLPTAEAFRARLFGHFGGFTASISKSLSAAYA